MSRGASKSAPADVARTLKASIGTSPSTALFPPAILPIALRSSVFLNSDSTTGSGESDGRSRSANTAAGRAQSRGTLRRFPPALQCPPSRRPRRSNASARPFCPCEVSGNISQPLCAVSAGRPFDLPC
eukprot:4737247-Pyramimonas_sp.AAC.1